MMRLHAREEPPASSDLLISRDRYETGGFDGAADT
jgi:hypothetical protein